MRTLSYAIPEHNQCGGVRNFGVFIPTLIAIALYVACGLWFHANGTAEVLLLGTIVVAEITTAFLLWTWRKRLHLLVIVWGWVIVTLWALFLSFLVAVNLGILME